MKTIRNMVYLLAMINILLSIGCQQVKNDKEFILTGKITGPIKDSIGIYFSDVNGKQIYQSHLLTKSGEFSFKGELACPTMASLMMKSKDEYRPIENNTARVFLEAGEMTFTTKAGEFGKAIVTGSKTQAELDELNKLNAPIDQEMKPFVDAYYNEKDHEKAAEIMDKFEPFNQRKAKNEYDFIEKHPDSYVAAYLLIFKASELTVDKLTYYYDRLTPAIKQSPNGKTVQEEIEKLRAGSPGSMATNFSTVDINGKPLSLSDFKGKYVILDFWASWCVPCRKSFPHMLELYSKYKDKGLEIVCISDDDSKPELWKAAVKKDGTGMWHHVLRGFDMEKLMRKEKNDKDISDKFGIHSLPTKILIDQTGKIIGRYGGGGENDEDMDNKLAEVFRQDK